MSHHGLNLAAGAGWIALIAAMPAGCSSQKAPTLVVTDAVVTSRTDEAIAVDVVVQMTNPNPIELELRDFNYRLSVDGRTAYAGRRAAEATLPGRGSKLVTLPAVIRFDEMGWSPGTEPPQTAYSIRGSLTYLSPGQIAEILFDTGVRKPKVSLAGDGTVALNSPAAAH